MTSTGTGNRSLTGTGILVALVSRRDRVRIPVWILAIVAFSVSFLPSLPDLYPDEASRQARAALITSPATIAMSGPGYGADDYTFGAMIANEFLGFVAIAMAIMSVLLVVRHTRAEEETGRAELVRSGVVGRDSAVAAAVGVTVAANLLIGLLVAVLMPLTLDSLSWSSSFLYGMSLTSVGVVFACVGAVVAQIPYAARSASGLGMAVIGAAFVLRAVGDTSVEALSWLSPIGWAQRTRSFVDDRWWPLLIPVGVSVLLLVCAVVLSRRRDVGTGLLQPRAGAATASAALSGPFGLALRLQRGTLIAWMVGLALFGLMYGSVITSEIESFAEDNPFLVEAFTQGGSTILESFFGVVVMLLALLTGGFVLQASLRVRAEETATRAEVILATAVPRARYAMSHLAIALVGGPVVLLTGVACLGVSAAVATGDWSLATDLLVLAVAYAPVLWLLVGLAAALYGLVPRAVALVWAVLAYAVLVGMLGAFLNIPEWMLDLSPFAHAPQSLSQTAEVGPLAVVTGIAMILFTVGLKGFRRRDLTG